MSNNASALYYHVVKMANNNDVHNIYSRRMFGTGGGRILFKICFFPLQP